MPPPLSIRCRKVGPVDRVSGLCQTPVSCPNYLLAYLKAAEGNVADATALINQLVPMIPEMQPYDLPAVLNALGRISSMAGNLEDAEAYYRTAVERSAGLKFTADWTVKDAASVLGNFASMLSRRGRITEAMPLFQSADGMLVTAGLEHSDLRATILDGIGEIHRMRHAYSEAYEIQRKALDIRVSTLPETHPNLGISFSNLGLTLLQAGEFETAADALSKAVTIQKSNGDAVRLANASINLSGALGALGEHGKAVNTAYAATESLRSVFPEGHPRMVASEFNRAWLHLGAGDSEKALQVSSRAMDDYIANSWQLDVDGQDTSAGLRDSRRQVLAALVSLWDVSRQEGIVRAFEVAQWAQASEAGHVARRVAARFAAGDSEVAALARQKQDLLNNWRAAEQQYLALLGSGGDSSLIQQDIRKLERQIETLDHDLTERFPDYATLTKPSVVSVSEVQSALGENEGFLLPVTTPDETYIFAITAEKAIWIRSPLTEARMEEMVRSLRAGLDPNAPARSAEALSDDPERPDFDVETAHELYALLLSETDGLFEGIETIFVVKEGALAGLPLSVLLTQPFDTDSFGADLSSADWLLNTYSLVTLPAASSLNTQRSIENPRSARVSFAGFGDPDFKGDPDQKAPETLAALYTRSGANGAKVENLAALPGTRREIEALAELLHAPEGAIYLGTHATETAVKTSQSLRDARVVVFATHGLVAGELSGLAEPALAFSAPSQISELDDGLLTASEAAQLDLVADWVILSACNTAASDGTPGGEGLSGLASAFLYAGARSLLVSHWPVRDDAAEFLTRGALKAQADDPGLGHSESLRRSMIDLIQNSGIEGAAHPSTWAPFTVVGTNG